MNMPTKEAAIGTPIQGTTTTGPTKDILKGKTISLNLAKRAYFRFQNRNDFELTKLHASAVVPHDLSPRETNDLLLLIDRRELVYGGTPGRVTKKKIDRVKPYLIFVEKSSNFLAIKRRVVEIAAMGGNVSNSGYSAREVLDMISSQELDGHARSDVLNLIDKVMASLPGSNVPHDEPGSHAVHESASGGRGDFGVEEETEPATAGSRSAREAIGRKPSTADIGSL